MKIVALVFLLFLATPAFAGGFGPWSFGMSAEDIRAVSAQGPYKSFSNGDLETYNGVFGGDKTNIQFFLKQGRLWRIGVYAYEGTDLSKATHVWSHAYATLKSAYGPIETPNYKGATLTVLSQSAKEIVVAGGKAQMAPVKQPTGAFIFSSFNSYANNGITYYIVTVYYDPPAP